MKLKLLHVIYDVEATGDPEGINGWNPVSSGHFVQTDAERHLREYQRMYPARRLRLVRVTKEILA